MTVSISGCTAAEPLCKYKSELYPLLTPTGINLGNFGHYEATNNITNTQDNFTQELRLQSTDSDSPFTWIVGFFYSNQSQLSVEEINDPQLPALTQFLWGESMQMAWLEDLLPNGDDYINHTLYNREPLNPGLWDGPFVVSAYHSNVSVQFAPNPHWSGTAPGFRTIDIRLLDNTAALQANLLSGDVDMRAELQKIRVPALIIHGDQDASAPIELTGRKTAELVGGASLTVYPGSGHGLYASDHDTLNGDLLAFIKS